MNRSLPNDAQPQRLRVGLRLKTPHAMATQLSRARVQISGALNLTHGCRILTGCLPLAGGRRQTWFVRTNRSYRCRSEQIANRTRGCNLRRLASQPNYP